MENPIYSVVLNPKSGSSGEEFRASIERALQERAVEFEVFETDPEEGAVPAVKRAVEGGATHILACGGDGTIMSAVNGLGKIEKSPETTLSIIPGGTANLLATALDIPHDVEKAIEIALTGEDRLIDLGECGGHIFALGLGLGLTEKLVSGTSAQEKEKLGRLAYVKAMLAEMGQKPHRFTFKLDDGKEQASSGVALVVANAGEIGGSLKFAPDAQMDDGVLDLVVLHRFYFRDLARLMLAGLTGKMADDRAVSFFQAAKIEITTDPPLDMQIDGEEVDTKPPLTIQVRPKALKMRMARKAAEEMDEGEK
ncbi:MAG: diacylglycerol kinase family lipid kinase [Armatimonadetes bacterium]|nr:diacylglycerol kinase family lipid kinase [Armatimonadota bacterium]